MTPPKSPPGLLDRLRRFDPAVLPIVVAAIVLIGAVVWLLGRPLPPPAAADPRLAEQIAGLRAELSRLDGLGQRIGALEGRTAPDLAPLREGLAGIGGRAQAMEQRLAAVEGRAGPDLAPLRAELGTAASRLAAIEDRLAVAQRDLAPRAALDQLGGRVETLAREAQAADAQIGQRLGAAEQALAGFAGRMAANETALGARSQAIEAQTARIGSVEQGIGGRIAALEGSIAQRIAALEGQIAQRGTVLDQQAGRLAALEGAAQRLTALEGRAARLAALDAVRTALDAGRPLGAPLRSLPSPPEALLRYADAAPPTEAQLRLSFEDAARAGRAASEPPAGASVLDSAVSRLSGLVTVRRGEEMLWGDAAAAEIERARRAVEAGDLDAALRFLQRLSAPAKEAMRNWIANAEALVAARAALRQLAAG